MYVYLHAHVHIVCTSQPDVLLSKLHFFPCTVDPLIVTTRFTDPDTPHILISGNPLCLGDNYTVTVTFGIESIMNTGMCVYMEYNESMSIMKSSGYIRFNVSEEVAGTGERICARVVLSDDEDQVIEGMHFCVPITCTFRFCCAVWLLCIYVADCLSSWMYLKPSDYFKAGWTVLKLSSPITIALTAQTDLQLVQLVVCT